MKKYNISGREFEILEIFWEQKRAFTAKQIQEINPELSLSTIQNTLKKLVKKKMCIRDRGIIQVKEMQYWLLFCLINTETIIIINLCDFFQSYKLI